MTNRSAKDLAEALEEVARNLRGAAAAGLNERP
jgi:hypothetical protein